MNPLEFAVHMEIEGEQFYRKQAENFQGTNLSVVFYKLANAEQKHAELIQALLDGLPVDLPEGQMTDNIRSVFTDLPDLKKQIEDVPDQMDAYILAVGVEQRSIDLYSELLRTASDSSNQALLQFLLVQERQHLTLFDELAELLNRPKEWVESAEFGEREEY
jgi:rubrerythrin